MKVARPQGRRSNMTTWRTRTRRRRWILGVAALVLLAALSYADHRGWLLYHGGDMQRYDGRRFRVVRVLDGTTLDVAAPDGAPGSARNFTRIRLWGAEAPELAHHGRPAQPGAVAAAQFTRRRCLGQVVRLCLQASRLRDKYSRLVAYVQLPDGSWLNEQLLARGLARADERFSHDLLPRYHQLAAQARHEGVGLWSARPPQPSTSPPNPRSPADAS